MTALAWSGPGVARAGTDDDAIDEAVPAVVVAPEHADDLAAALAEASRLRAATDGDVRHRAWTSSSRRPVSIASSRIVTAI
jgi:hypothetical protein